MSKKKTKYVKLKLEITGNPTEDDIDYFMNNHVGNLTMSGKYTVKIVGFEDMPEEEEPVCLLPPVEGYEGEF